MIGQLPKKLKINEIDRAIRSDFRVAILIFQAFNDAELTDQEKGQVLLECLYEDFENIPYEDYQEAQDKAVWFLDGGEEVDEKEKYSKKIMDWEKDEQIIFPAVNKIAGFETRSTEYIHWWTFLGYMRETRDSLFNLVLDIRQKKAKGKKLDKSEEQFYNENKKLIKIENKYSEEEKAEYDALNKLFS